MQKVDNYFNAREALYDYIGIDTLHDLEDHREMYWYKTEDNRLLFSDDLGSIDVEHLDAEYEEEICVNRYFTLEDLKESVIEKEGLTFIRLRDNFGGDPYFVILDNTKRLKDEN